MAENVPASASSSLPPAQAAAGPQNQQFDGAQGNGQANSSHMPPPPRPPVIIPQTNPIPTAITSPLSGGMMSPTSAGGYVRRAAPEPNKRALYVGGLDPRVTEDILKQIFETTGHVVSVKIIPDKNVSSWPSRFLTPRWIWGIIPTRNIHPTSSNPKLAYLSKSLFYLLVHTNRLASTVQQ